MDTQERQELQEVLRGVLREEMDRMCQEMFHGQFYQKLAREMENGIGEIYREIDAFKKVVLQSGESLGESSELLGQASDQLEGIVDTTEEATNRIMDRVEACQQRANRMARILARLPASKERSEIQELVGATNQDYMEIITACSFQDLTGQKVRRVVELIRTLEERILTLLVSSSTKLRQKEAGADERQIEGRTREVLQRLGVGSGSAKGFDQAEVDALLAELMGS